MSVGTLLGLFAETPLHPGAGQAADVVDLPVAREAATGFPQIPDTGLKGALRQWAEARWPGREGQDATAEEKANKAKTDGYFGAENSGAGGVMMSSARLLCLPIRRLDGPYAWVTTPYLLERLRRDSERCGCGLRPPAIGAEDFGTTDLVVSDNPGQQIFLEEFSFTTALNEMFKAVQSAITPLIGAEDKTKQRLLSQLAIMSDEEFAWFAQNALPVNARNSLDDNKMSQYLWYEEVIPPDALFYSVILPRNEAVRAGTNAFMKELIDARYIQIGGNETVGQGWVRLAQVGGTDHAA